MNNKNHLSVIGYYVSTCSIVLLCDKNYTSFNDLPLSYFDCTYENVSSNYFRYHTKNVSIGTRFRKKKCNLFDVLEVTTRRPKWQDCLTS